METPQALSPSASHGTDATPPPVLPDELIVEILSFLPVKSLLRFRCVCKSWKSLISKPNFVKLHLLRSPRNVNLLLLRTYVADKCQCQSIVPRSVRALLENPSSPIDEDDCYQLNNDSGYRYMVGSCNGLVCYYHLNMIEQFRQFYFYLCNPATKLTSQKLACLRVPDYHMYYRFSFGYDILSDSYKVVAYRFDEELQKNQVKICNFGDNCWRNIDSFPVAPFGFGCPSVGRLNGGVSVYFNGTLNWLALLNSNRWVHSSTISQTVIVSLDLGMETYTQLLLPCLESNEAPSPEPCLLALEPVIGVLMDCLCFSHCKDNQFVIWQMKEFGIEKSWTQIIKASYQDLQIERYKFFYQGLQIESYNLFYPLLPLCMSENGDVLILTSKLGKSQAIMYHRRDNRVEQTELPNRIIWQSTMDYVESLVSPCCH